MSKITRDHETASTDSLRAAEITRLDRAACKYRELLIQKCDEATALRDERDALAQDAAKLRAAVRRWVEACARLESEDVLLLDEEAWKDRCSDANEKAIALRAALSTTTERKK
jgi:hypothetical protein